MQVNKILFITLSNIGDVILTLPVLDALRENFPKSRITVMVGKRPKEIFENNPCVNRLIVYDKHSKLKEKIKLFFGLKKERFDLVVDLRNSFFGALLVASSRTPSLMIIPKNIMHMHDRHLYRLQAISLQFAACDIQRNSLFIRPQDEEHIDKILKENNITDQDKIVIISEGARSHIKRWLEDKFVDLISLLVEEFKVHPHTNCNIASSKYAIGVGVKLILVGDKDDIAIGQYIAGQSKESVVDLSGKTNIGQLASLLKKAALLVTNDSAVLHLASYLNIPIVAIFGPTNELKYGPWSEINAVVKKDIFCRPCEKAQCRFGNLDCMQLIKAEDVLRQIRNILNYKLQITNYKQTTNYKLQTTNQYKRILIVRTDRMGDVLLSTPVIKALRDEYPTAYIAAMVSPYAKDTVCGNPYLDEVIIYDKDAKHKRLGSIKFTRNLKKKRFDLALILHPTNRMHLVTFFAGIPRRIGYNRKLGFLLTDRIKHTKQLGEKHELEYSLDLVRYLGIKPKDKELFMPINSESEKWVEELFRQEIKGTNKLLAIHPGASCLSKVWPQDRFAQVADKLAEKYGFKILIVAGPKDITLAQNVIKNMKGQAINLAGKTSISQLASILKRCQLFISNDSGPVHIASSLGTPVISIFGRNQKGLSPNRWGPVGKRDKILHKEVGCIECLAHNCIKEFACLKAITVDEVINAADTILSTSSKPSTTSKPASELNSDAGLEVVEGLEEVL